jgi:hypothetical protein
MYWRNSLLCWPILVARALLAWDPSPSGIVNCSKYLVRTGTYRLVPCFSIIPPCTTPFEYVLFIQSTYQYVLFTPSTYQVHTYVGSTYSVRTEYRIHDKSTYLRLKVHTFRVTYRYEPVRIEYILFFLFLYRFFFISKGYIQCTY